MVECQLPKLKVAGSNPVSRSKLNHQATEDINARLVIELRKRDSKASFRRDEQERKPAGSRFRKRVGADGADT